MPTDAPPAADPMVALEAEIAAARAELVTTLTQLKAETTPGALARRGKAAVVGWFTDESGAISPQRVVIAGVAVVGLVAFTVLRRRRR